MRSLRLCMSWWILLACSGCGQRAEDATTPLEDLFGAEAVEGDKRWNRGEEWARAVEPREFLFPRDHGPHPGFRIEWWYYTGNLRTKEGRRFGYQLTFFRTGLQQQPDNPSRWTVRDLYPAHFAISDIDRKRHFSFERTSRAGVGLAGADADTYRIWNGNWELKLEEDEHRLEASDGRQSISLSLKSTKPITLHGESGLSRKGSDEGNASYYYSLTRMRTRGEIEVAGESYSVEGESWMDHEFSTSFLQENQLGWDWFSIQLDNDEEIMLYQMRQRDGSIDPFSSGTFVDSQGNATHLSSREFTVEPLSTWISTKTKAAYPLAWRVKIPRLGYDLEIQPAFERQEMTTEASTGVSYWEGSIEVSGRSKTATIRGMGYLELTGYSGRSLGALFEP